MTRRTDLHALAACLLIATTVGCSSAAPEPEPIVVPEIDDPVFTLEHVTDGVWATPVREGISPSQFAMSVIIVRDDHVVVVDSRQGPAAANRLIDAISQVTPLPVRYLINTHWHGDHVQGNQAFKAAFPDLVIIGGATIAEDMATLGRARLDDEIGRVEARLAGRQVDLDTLSAPDGERASELRSEIAQLEAYLDDRRGLELIPPDVEVGEWFDLDDGDPRVRIERIGPAHTSGDVIISVPESGVLVVGDLLEDGFPWFGDGYPSGWGAALDRISGLSASVLLPAHGPVLRDSEFLETQRAFVNEVVAAAQENQSRGEPIADTLERHAHFGSFEAHFTRRLEGASPELRRDRYRAFVEETFGRAVAEAAGDL